MDRQPTIIIQASSRSWSGGPDLCLRPVQGKPAAFHTIQRALDAFPESKLILAAPEFDRGGTLSDIAAEFPTSQVHIYYGQDTSPLLRILKATENLSDNDYLVRIDGLHLCFDSQAALQMLEQAISDSLDVVKFPDDFPVQFTVDIYRTGALRRLKSILNDQEDQPFHVHPKFFMFSHPDRFSCAYIKKAPEYKKSFLLESRKLAKEIYNQHRIDLMFDPLLIGDQRDFHYKIAAEHLTQDMKVLDIACGQGHGTIYLSNKVSEIHGADIDKKVIEEANSISDRANTFFHVEDIINTNFEDNSFDAVVSMETIEHVDAMSCLKELHRIIRPGGLLILSTPQNRFGHTPIIWCHQREYSLNEIKEICGSFFNLNKVIGIKAGKITIENDPIGMNTVIIAEKHDIGS